MLRFYFTLTLVVWSFLIWAQSNGRSVLLQSQNVTPTQAAHVGSEEVLQQLASFDGQYYGLVQFATIPGSAERAQLEASGIQLHEYLPHNTYYATLPISTKRQTLQQAGITHLFQLQPQHKLHPWLSDLSDSLYWVSPNGNWTLNLIPYPDYAQTSLSELLTGMGIAIIDQPFANRITVKIDPQQLPLLALLPIIRFIEPGDPPAIPENYTARTLTRSNAIHTDYGAGRQYTGKGVTVGLQDDGLISNHIDYTGRVTQNANGDGGNHGDHIAGTIMGAGNLEPIARGMAYEGNLYVRWVYDIINNMYNHYNNDDVYITSTSYSNGCNAGYTSFTQTHDQQTLDLPRLLHVFSAGNSASSNCGYGAGSGWGNITGGHKVGKNVIAVGSLTENDELSSFSSRGPAHDGRVKPDICAKGSGVYSTVSNSPFYAVYSGTSMSCPNVSGILAQLYDAYRQHNNGQWANSALLKAIILNTADDLGNPGPDYKFGWGRINALRAAKVIENKSYFTNSVQQGGVRQHQINVPAGAKEIRVMVYWHDKVAAVGAAKALVNDIDMTLSTPNGQSLQPWILNPAPNPTTLDQPAVRGVDTLNNMEQVTLENPVAGTYTVLVNGNTIPQGPQNYYVIYEIKYNSLEITYPMGGEALVPGEEAIIRWDAGSTGSTFAIEWTTDNGTTWQTIASNLAPEVRQYNWNVPNEVTGKARIRVKQGNLTAQSPAAFSIIDVPANLFVAWSCGDSLKLKWDSVPGATFYEISQLGAKYMDSVGQTSQLNFTVKGLSPAASYWFSVRALNNQGASGRRARAIQKTPGDINCIPFDASVFALVNPSNNAYASCNSTQQQVVIRVLNNGVSSIDSIPVAYQIDNNPVVWDTVFERLSSAEDVYFTFTTPLPPLSIGSHTITTWTALPGDLTPGNDTVIETFSIYNSTIATLPYTQDFDNFTNCTTSWGCEEISCSLSEDWHNGVNGLDDQLDWRTHNGGTGSSGTGPSGDHTSGIGKYLYIESSGNGGSGCQNNTAKVYSPCFDLSQTNQPKLHYWLHMFGGSIGGVQIDLFDGEKWQKAVKSYSGSQGNAWFEDSIDLSPYAPNIISVSISGTTGNSYTSDMAIDDILISTLPTSRFTLSDTLGCPGQAITLQSTAWYATSQEWIITGGQYQFINGTSATDPNPVVELLDEGQYTISLVTFNAFGTDTLTLPNAYFTGPHPMAITSDDPDNAICPGSAVAFTAKANASTYQWYLNSLLAQNSTTTTFQLPGIQQDTWVIGEGTLPGGCKTERDSIFIRVSQLSAQSQPNQPVSCFGGQNGIATALPFNGIAPYQYSWSNGQQQAQATNLPAGTYSCTITDVTGCSGTTNITITEPQPLQTTTTANAPICNGGSNGQAQVQINGGNGGYNSTWNTGQNSAFINGLTAGTYTVTVTDNKGCTTVDSVTVTDPLPINIALVAMEPADCFGQASGSVTVTAQQGTRPYNWQWSNGIQDSMLQQTAAGTYRVTVTDANNCRQIDSVTITQPASSLSIALQSTSLRCYADSNATASVIAQGGVGPYRFEWSTGAQSPAVQGLAAGTYYVTITDKNQCGALDSVVISQPAAIAVDSSQVEQVACFGDSTGSITLFTSGGTGQLNANWTDGLSGLQRFDLAAGAYEVIITDNNQCTANFNYTISQPDSLAVGTLQATDSICAATNTASISVTGLGGMAPYQYAWNNGSQDSMVALQPAGSYAVTVTDANGCNSAATYAVYEYPVTPLGILPNDTAFVCPGEQLTMDATGNFQVWAWSTGDTTAQVSLPAGQYALVATDGNGCVATIDTILIQSYAAPAAKTIAGRDTVLVNTTEVYQTNGAAASTYEWMVSGGAIANGQGTVTITINWLTAGWQDIVVIERTQDGCLGDTISQAVWVDRSTGVATTALSINVYPNPTNGWLQIDGLSGECAIRVVTVTGQVIYQTTTHATTHALNLFGQAQGIYLLEIVAGSQTWTQRIVKQ